MITVLRYLKVGILWHKANSPFFLSSEQYMDYLNSTVLKPCLVYLA